VPVRMATRRKFYVGPGQGAEMAGTEARRGLVVATGNSKKLKELKAILARVAPGASLLTTGELGLPSPDETGTTFSANALIKARAAFCATGMASLADDSGLVVDALGGAPGVYSARYAADMHEEAAWEAMDQAARDAANNARVMAALAGVPEARRGAAFRCAIALVWPLDREVAIPGACREAASGDTPAHAWLVAEGRVGGRIVTESPSGSGGFGYDPYFLHPPSGCTFAELDAGAKHALSHRGQALAALEPAFRVLLGEA
jgi:XTP/dITP diphosphohydrolase